MGSGLPQTGVELVAANLSGFLSTLDQGNAAVAKFGHGMDTGAQQTKTAGDFMSGALQQLGSIAVNALLKAGQAVIKFGQDSIQVAGDFQAGMQQFQAVAGADVNTQGLQQFHDLFIQLGKDLPVSTSDVQQAAIEMVKGGIDPATIAAGGLRQNIQFAAAAMNGDLVEAATVSAKILGGWADMNATAAEKSDFLTKATDLLTKAANASSVDVHELSLGIFNAQGTARAAGVEFNDLVTTLAELAPRFASSSEAGNALKNVIVRMQPTTKPAIAAFEELGLMTTSTSKLMNYLQSVGIKPLGKDVDTLGNQFTEFAASQGFTQKATDKLWATFNQSKFFDEVTGKFIGFQKASELLKDSFVGLTDAQKVQQLQTMFGADGMNAASALVENGAEGYQKMADALLKANGVQANAALTQAGFNTSMENTKGSIEALQITLGEKFLPILGTVMDTYIAPAINTLTTFAGAVLGSKEAFDKLPDVLKPIAGYIKDVVDGFSGWEKGTLSFKTALEIVYPGLSKVVDVVQQLGQFLSDNLETIEAVGVAFASFAVLSTVVGAISGVIASVAALGAAFTAAGSGIGFVVAILGGPVTLAIAAVAAAVAVLYLAWTNDWGGIQEIVASAWTAVQPTFASLYDWLATQIPAAIQVVSTFWTETLWPALQQVGDFISTTIVPILQTLGQVALAQLQVEVNVLAAVWQNVLWPALKIVWDFLANTLIPIIAALVDVNIAALQLAVTVLAGLWQNVLWPALKAVGTYLSDTLGPVIQSVGKWFTETVNPALQEAVTWLNNTTGGFKGIGGAVDTVLGKIHEFADSLRNLSGKLPDWLVTHSPTPFEMGLRGIARTLDTDVTPGLENFTTSLERMAPAVTTAGKNAIEGLDGAFTSDIVTNHAKELADGIVQAFKGTWKEASPSKVFYDIGINAAIGLENALTASIPGLHGVVEQMGVDLMNTTRHHLQSTVDEINAMIEDLQKKIDDAQKMATGLVTGGYSSKANIDRQVLSNQDELDKIQDARAKLVAANQLQDAQKAAKLMQDPAQAAEYFKARSEAIIEQGKLQDQIAATNDQKEKERLIQRWTIIEDAQRNEAAALQADQAGGSATSKYLASLQEILSNSKLPGIFDNDQIRNISNLINQLQNMPTTGLNALQALAYQPQSNSTNTTQYNLGITTNQSPAVVQQGFSAIQASQI